MPKTPISMRIDDDALAAFKAKAEEKNQPVGSYLADLLEDKIAGANAPATIADLDAATNLYLNLLEAAHRDLIWQCANERHMAPAAFLLSAIKLAYERGEAGMILGEVSLEPALQAQMPRAPEPAKAGHCEYCGNIFVPTRPGQRYCPPPEDGREPCGRLAGLAEIRAKLNKPTVDKDANRFAPKPALAPST